MTYRYKCKNPECDVTYFYNDVGHFDEDKFNRGEYATAECPQCEVRGNKIIDFSCPGIIYRGLGFSKNDDEYEKQLHIAEGIAERAPKRRAEQSVAKDPLSKDDAFWNELASREYQKEVLKHRIYSGPPTTVFPDREAKASRNIASSSGVVGVKEKSKRKK